MNSTRRRLAGGTPVFSRDASLSQPAAARASTSARSALVGDAFRVIAGALLVVHYGQQVRLASFTPLAWPFAGPVQGLPMAGAVLGGLGVAGLRAWFTLAVLIAGFIAVGVAPRVCGILLVCVSATTYYVLQPVVTPDDYVAEVLPFWLALLPIGETLALTRARDWRSWQGRRVEGRAATGCAIFFFFVLANVVLRCDPMPPMAPIGLFAAASLAITPVRFVRRLASLPAMATLWSLRHLDGASLVRGASAATCVLWAMSATTTLSEGPESNGSGARFGTADAIGATAVFLIATQTAAMAMRIPTVARSASAVLAHAGLPWSWGTPLDPEPVGKLQVAIADTDGNEVPALDTGNVRVQRMLRFLQVSRQEGAQYRVSLIRSIVTKHCSEDSAPWFRQGVIVLHGPGGARRLARFQCATEQEDAQVTLLDEEGGAAGPPGS